MNAPARLLFLAAPLLLAGCTAVADADDPTPPELTFRYRLNDDLWTEVPASGLEITMDRDDTLHVWGYAEDDGGVFRCAVQGSGKARCTSAGGVSFPSLSFLEEAYAPEGTGSGDSTYAQRSAHLTITRADLCASGSPAGTEFTLSAEAFNFNERPGAGQALSGELAVEVE